MSDFQSLGLPARLTGPLAAAGFTQPTKIQSQAIPLVLEGRDVMGIAQTGSGKTAAFGLPILAGITDLEERPRPRTTHALILAPTRELAVQIDESLRKYAGPKSRLQTVLLLGGVSRHHQIKRLERGMDVVIATPGRLKDLMDDNKIRLAGTKWLVLDEADRMLDMGFIVPVRQIVKAIGAERQTMMFSATMAPEVADLAKALLRDPVRVEAATAGSTVTKIDQRVILAPTKAKRGVLNDLLASETEMMERVIVFSRTKHGADRVAKNLAMDGHRAAAIHGNKSQNARQAALKDFTKGAVRILVATDIAARGIDVPGITHVVNYELPDDPENYVHRIGRTGRNGASGIAITLCDGAERRKLRDVERLVKLTLPLSGDFKAANDAETAPAGAAREGARKVQRNKPARNRFHNDNRASGGAGEAPAGRDGEHKPARSPRPANGKGRPFGQKKRGFGNNKPKGARTARSA